MSTVVCARWRHSDHTKYTRSEKVHELATVCLPWQHWTKALVWFDDLDISAYASAKQYLDTVVTCITWPIAVKTERGFLLSLYERLDN